MIWLQMQIGTDEINHGTVRYVVNNRTWRVEVPDDVAAFMLEDGRKEETLARLQPGSTLHASHLPLIEAIGPAIAAALHRLEVHREKKGK